MRRILSTIASLLFIPAVAFAGPAVQVASDPCWEAVIGSLAHFSIGDGAPLGCEVLFYGGDTETVPPAGAIYCEVPGNGGVRCDLYGEYCSSVADVNPHNAPGVGVCFQGCGASPGNPKRMTINQAKCCLMTGSMQHPNCP